MKKLNPRKLFQRSLSTDLKLVSQRHMGLKHSRLTRLRLWLAYGADVKHVVLKPIVSQTFDNGDEVHLYADGTKITLGTVNGLTPELFHK